MIERTRFSSEQALAGKHARKRGGHVEFADRKRLFRRRAARSLQKLACVFFAVALVAGSVQFAGLGSSVGAQAEPAAVSPSVVQVDGGTGFASPSAGTGAWMVSSALSSVAAQSDDPASSGAGESADGSAGESAGAPGASADFASADISAGAGEDANANGEPSGGSSLVADAGADASAGEPALGASVAGANTGGGSANVNTGGGSSASPHMVLDDTKSIVSVNVFYKVLLEPGDAGYDPSASFSAYDPSENPTSIVVSKKGGSVQLAAEVVYSDGSREAIEATDGKANLDWRITAAYDESGDELAGALLAKVDATGKLSAQAAGNGVVRVRCASNAYPDFAGQDVLVRIENNGGTARSVIQASAYAKNEGSSQYQLCDEGRVATISSKFGDCALDASVTFDDKSFGFASEYGLDPHWRVSASYNQKGVALSTPLAKVSPNGMVSALGIGDGYVVVEGEIAGVSLSVKVSISGNGTPDKPSVAPVRLQFKYADVNHLFPVDYKSATLPEIVSKNGSCQLIPYILWSDGSMTKASDSGYAVSWSIYSFVDFNGNTPPVALALIENDGTVRAMGLGNGIAMFKCTLVGANVPSVPSTLSVEIRGNSEDAYVKSVDILRADGSAYGDDGIEMQTGANVLQLYARVNYSDGTSNSTLISDSGSTTFATSAELSLEWRNYRGATTEKELYSELDENGKFIAKSGFRECRVVATVRGGGFYGNDVSQSVRIYRDNDEDRVGTSSAVKIRVIEESEYMAYVKSGYTIEPLVVSEDTVTASQIAASGQTYSDWFTLRKKSGSWGTLYANGISIPSLLGLVGISAQDVQHMEFSDDTGFTGDAGFYSAETIMGSRYRYGNYYMRPVSSSPSYLQQSSVVPMLALSYFYDEGRDPTGSGYDNMRTDSCLRLVMGMNDIDDGNARRMVRCVSDITVIVKDKPNEPEPKDDPGTGEEGNGSGSGSDTGGGRGAAAGMASEGQDGGDGTGGAGSNGADGDSDSSLRLRELVDNTEVRDALKEVVRDNPWRTVALVLVIAALVAGACGKAWRFKMRLKDGERMAHV